MPLFSYIFIISEDLNVLKCYVNLNADYISLNTDSQ